MKIQCGGLTFFSNFDSGNLARVELTQPAFLPTIVQNLTNYEHKAKDTNPSGLQKSYHLSYDEIEPEPLPSVYSVGEFSTVADFVPLESGPDKSRTTTSGEDYVQLEADPLEFNVWTRTDCEGTPFENGNRTWFYFGVEGGIPKQKIRINVMNLNLQTKLMSQGMLPVYRVLPGKESWDRILSKLSYKSEGSNFIISFNHEMPLETGRQVFFAFTYPFSYTACQKLLGSIDAELPNGLYANGSENENDLYYSRELLCNSLCGRRIDLLTITSHGNILSEREARLEHLFPDTSQPRSHRFLEKRVVFVSGRVHPGETQSSLILNGLLRFLLSQTDLRARRLRDIFVFKLIPMLNPDGVALGHYRTNSVGVNMNRVYLTATAETDPPIYASRSLIMYYHYEYSPVRASRNIDRLRISDLLQVDIGREEKLSVSRRNSATPSSEEWRKGLLLIAQVLNDAKRKQHAAFECKKNAPLTKQMAPLKPRESGIALFVDLHGHASKRGCFMFGNYCGDLEDRVDNMLLSKLMTLNCPHFDFGSCNFSYQNMYSRGRKDGANKEGTARVAVHLQTGIIHSYTLECNFNTGRNVNVLPALDDDKADTTLRRWPRKIPKYTPKIFEEIGKALAISILDMTGQNATSRLQNSAYQDLEGVRQWLRCYVRNKKVHVPTYWPSSRHNSWTGAPDSETNGVEKSKVYCDASLQLPESVFLLPSRSSSGVSNKESSGRSEVHSEGYAAANTRYRRQLKVATTIVQAVSNKSTPKHVVTVRLPLPTIVHPESPSAHGVRNLGLANVGKVSSMVQKLRKKRYQNAAADKNAQTVGSSPTHRVQLLVQGEICRQGQRFAQTIPKGQRPARRKSPRTGSRGLPS